MIKIYVADLERYNNGYLVGKWFDLDDYSDSDDLQEDIQGMLDEHDNEEWAIHDYDFNCSGIDGLGEYEDLEQLIELNDMLNEDDKKVLAFIEYFGISDVFNVSYWDDVRFYEDIENAYDIGYYWMIELGCYDIPENLEMYIDFEKWGNDYLINASGGITSYGFIEWD